MLLVNVNLREFEVSVMVKKDAQETWDVKITEVQNLVNVLDMNGMIFVKILAMILD